MLAPSISRALVLSGICCSLTQSQRNIYLRLTAGHQIHFYTLPALDMVPLNLIKPIRNVVAFAVDELHMKRPPQYANDIPVPVEPIEFCVVKRSAIALYSLRERLFFQKVGFSHGFSAHPLMIALRRRYRFLQEGCTRGGLGSTSVLRTAKTTTSSTSCKRPSSLSSPYLRQWTQPSLSSHR